MQVPVPTTAADVRLLGRTLRLVLGVPAYAAVAVLGGFGFLTGVAVREHWRLFRGHFLGASHLSATGRLELFASFYPVYGDGFALYVEVALVAVAALVGANLALLVSHAREHDLSASGSGGSLAGVLLGVLGAGCAACGSAVLLGVLGVIGAGGALAVLPLDGVEFALLAVAVLLLSAYWIADGMRGGRIRGCPVEVGGR